jgi:hypothetical protein
MIILKNPVHPVKNDGSFLFNHGLRGLSRIRERFGRPLVLSVFIRAICGQFINLSVEAGKARRARIALGGSR